MAGHAEAECDEAGSKVPSLTDGWTVSTDETPGHVIDRFRLVRRLGEGGMGTVWQAEQTAPVRRVVALKIVKLGMDTREVVSRFRREQELLARMNHPNIAQVFEAGATASGRPYFVMELVEGEPITTYCERWKLGLPERLALFQTACAGVEHAHQKGVIHRDLKPSNILVSEAGVKVIDFGVAKATQGSGDTLFTRGVQVLGTPAYMSPEQALSGEMGIDTRSDVYALGVLLYELITGTLPFDQNRLAHSGLAELQRILTEEYPPTPSARLTRRVRERANPPAVSTSPLSGDLDRVVMKAIRKLPAERYASAAALAEDLGRYLAGEPVTATPPTLLYLAGKFVRRHQVAVAAAALVAVSLAIGTVASVRSAVRANRAREETTLTLADMHARSGLVSAENRDPAQAALWFANAAAIAGHDPVRREGHHRRATAWRHLAHVPVRALDAGHGLMSRLVWNPSHPALIVSSNPAAPSAIWNVDADTLWSPPNRSPLAGVVWDSSGNHLAARDGTNLVVLDYPSGAERARLPVTPSALAFSPDNQWVAVGAQPPFLWHWTSGRQTPLPAMGGPILRFGFSTDGAQLLAQSPDQVGICALSNPSVFRHAPTPNAISAANGFLGNGTLYWSGDTAGTTFVRDSATGTAVERYEGHPNAFPMAASPDGRFLARQSAPIIDRATGHPTAFPFHKNTFTDGGFSPDGAWFASASYDRTAKRWRLPDGAAADTIGVHQHTVDRLAWSPRGDLIATSQFGLVRLWRLAAPPAGRTLGFDQQSLVALSDDGHLLAPSGNAHRDGALNRTRVFGVADGAPVGPELVPGGLVMDAVFEPDSRWLALSVSTTPDRPRFPLGSRTGSGNVQLWDFRAGRRSMEPIALPSEPRGLAVHPSGRWIGVVCQAGEGVEIEVATGKATVLFRDAFLNDASATIVNGLCRFSPDGRLFIAHGTYQFLHLWDREAGRELVPTSRPDQNTFDLDFSGSTLVGAVVTMASRVEFLDTHTGATVAPSIPFSAWPMLSRFSPDGRLLLTTGGNNVGQVWDWRSGVQVCPALRHDDQMMAGAFIPGTPWVATGGHDGRIKFWDHRTGMPVGPSIQRPGAILQLKATPDGKRLVAAGLAPDSIECFDLETLLPAPTLSVEDELLLAEINAGARLHPGGDLVPLTREEWIERWKTFRQRQPQFPGHRTGW